MCGVKNALASEPSPALQTVTDSSTCAVCTFVNHPSMIQCEICGADLPREIVPTATTSSSSIVSNSDVNHAQIRLSFRKGGQPTFLTKLKAAVAEKQWEKVYTYT